MNLSVYYAKDFGKMQKTSNYSQILNIMINNSATQNSMNEPREYNIRVF